jgi:archaellin
MARTTFVAVLFAAFVLAAVAVDATTALQGTSMRKLLGDHYSSCVQQCGQACGHKGVCQVATGTGLLNIGVCAVVLGCDKVAKVDLAGCCCFCNE